MFAPFFSRVADASFSDLPLLGRLCVQSRLVREAMVAYAVAGDPGASDFHYKMSLKGYQKCIAGLQKKDVLSNQSLEESTFSLVAIFFLGLLEGLKLGSSSTAVVHLDMCRKILVGQLAQVMAVEDPDLLAVLRVVAESVLYIVANLTPYVPRVDSAMDDWGDVLSFLFPGNGASTSPFLGGLQGIYRAQLRIHLLLRSTEQLTDHPGWNQSRCDTIRDISEQLDSLGGQLCLLSTQRKGSLENTAIYDAKHRISILAARIHLYKVANPSATSLDQHVQFYVREATTILRKQDIIAPGCPPLRWPLTVLGCAAITNEDFDLVTGMMKRTDRLLDPANSRKLEITYDILHRHRKGCASLPLGSLEQGPYIQPMEFLLMPQLLDEGQI